MAWKGRGVLWLLFCSATACGGTTVSSTGTADHGGSRGGHATFTDAGNGGSGAAATVDAGRSGSAGSASGGEGPSASLGVVQINFSGGARTYCARPCKQHIEILDPAGNIVHPAGDCVGASCPACGFAVCGADSCIGTVQLFVAANLTWDGAYDDLTVCADGTSCLAPHYAPEGVYSVRLCLPPGGLVADGPEPCAATGPAECTTVSFIYPGSGSVHAPMGCIAPDTPCTISDVCCETNARCVGGFCAAPL